MRSLIRTALVVMTVAPVFAQSASQTDYTAAGKLWWSHIEYLAGDELQGRQTGSDGYNKGAAFVVDHFKQYGLQPAGTEGFLQPVNFDVTRVLAAQSSASLVSKSAAQDLAIGPDILLGSRLKEPAIVDAPMVFIGYGLHMPDVHYDDFASMDLKGKVIVLLNGGPADVPAALKSHARAAEFSKAAAAAGAIAAITIPIPRGMDIPWERQILLSTQDRMRLADADMQTPGPIVTATFNPAQAEKLFAGSGHTFAEILALGNDGKPLPRFPLALSLRAKVVTQNEKAVSPNIIGKLEGSDPALKDQYVLVSAHLDHIGIGAPINGDKIYHGAMDDASGVASVMEIAHAITSSGFKPKRSILFVIFTAEEKGLLGSHFYAEHPSVAKASIAADLNMDMFLPLYPMHYVMIQGVNESSLGTNARAVAKNLGYEVTTDPYPDRNSFVRTDQYSFVRAGIPALAIKVGFALGSPEQQMEKDWRTNRYHSPADNLSQPVDLNSAAHFDEFMVKLAESVADDPPRPSWAEASFFRRYATK
ncbi:M20/M25/M40 family metallo-hydrolase [Granulicella arctica]|uniref:M20/M25/M40 family metallo-hydrolase n=1 Tax=Granulicella arctica TaxID=940613 RepID=UPI0021E072DA|nr:M20/M25/M40 family metallo-hydrolase [Granulicella arctica]